MNNESKSTVKSPKVAIILVGVLALFQLVRIGAYPIIQDVLTGTNAEAWLFPAMMDVFVGVTALFVAIGIWRGKGLLPWVSAIVFFCLSISDHLDAITVRLLGNGPHPAMMSGAASGVAIQLGVMSLLEVAAIFALTSKNMREHYLVSGAVK